MKKKLLLLLVVVSIFLINCATKGDIYQSYVETKRPEVVKYFVCNSCISIFLDTAGNIWYCEHGNEFDGKETKRVFAFTIEKCK